MRRGEKVLFRGTVPAGFMMHLTIDDSVWYRQGNKMVKKWGIELHRGVPHMRFGNSFGRPKHRVKIEGGENE